jgi:NACalpha-BTF3-like transcription factor
VIGKQRGAFKKTFEAAQKQLRSKFGMEMVELPAREKVTMKEKRGQSIISTERPVLTHHSGTKN